jgi:uncharacterized protein (DUF305 family)
MNSSRSTGAILILCTISVAIVTLQAIAQQHKNDEPNMVPAHAQTPSKLMHQAMMAPMQKMGKMTGNVDRDFASMMAEHHRSAIDMARLELRFGKNIELKRMARNIVATQSKEIAILDRFAKLP